MLISNFSIRANNLTGHTPHVIYITVYPVQLKEAVDASVVDPEHFIMVGSRSITETGSDLSVIKVCEVYAILSLKVVAKSFYKIFIFFEELQMSSSSSGVPLTVEFIPYRTLPLPLSTRKNRKNNPRSTALPVGHWAMDTPYLISWSGKKLTASTTTFQLLIGPPAKLDKIMAGPLI